MKAMLFAAGLGTRLKPITDNCPKALVKIRGITMLERCLRYLMNNGIRDITVNIHHFADMIRSFINEHKFDCSIHISDESTELLDTGGGLLKARPFLHGAEPILLLNVDLLTNFDIAPMLQQHLHSNALATLAMRHRQSARYLLFDQQNQLCGWQNTKTGEEIISRNTPPDQRNALAFSGIHIISPRIFELITETGKFSIIDLYLRLSASEALLAFIDDASEWMDIGRYEDLLKLQNSELP
jgi:NDP-sugar pyrophosphorylase family protein